MEAIRERVLFLDVDGVLNNEGVFSDRRFGFLPIDNLCVERLHRVVRETECSIVLSSAWRGSDWHERKLEAEFVFECYFGELPHAERINVRHEDGSTKRLSGADYNGRGSEIAEWLSRHPEVKQYAIVDDDGDMLPDQMERFVQTTFETGLSNQHADQLIATLRARLAEHREGGE